MLQGLALYGDDSGSSDDEKPSTSPHKTANDSKQKLSNATVSDSMRKPSANNLKGQIVIRRPATQHAHPRVKDEQNDAAPSPSRPKPRSPNRNAEASSSRALSEPQDELARIRELLTPPPIPGVEDWGIPPATEEPCDPAIQSKLAQFHALKAANPPKHFNDSLMGSRAVPEPTLLWDPGNVEKGWYAESIAELQKARAESQTANQAPGKRSQIQFTKATAAPAPKERDKDKRYHPYVSSSGHEKKSRWGQ
ncbi:HCNGP-domain-containing protein [Mycena kentingensis (nom. inval.)]|nr:HCNGP-domain-containing protein [Mycena kentingensis (nom. inval.)]